MSDNQQFCLRWNNHQSTLVQVIDNLLSSGVLVDCTLAAEGQYLHAHKVVLCACSPYLEVSYFVLIIVIFLVLNLLPNSTSEIFFQILHFASRFALHFQRINLLSSVLRN